MTQHFRTLWLSDTHLGDSSCHAGELLTFLRSCSADTIYLVGDILDLGKLGTRSRIPASHIEVMLHLIELASQPCRLVYLPGHHDSALRHLADESIAGIEIASQTEHVTADGKRLLVLHGDELDSRIRRGTQLERFASNSYTWLVEANRRFSELSNSFEGQESPVAIGVRKRLAKAREYIRRFESVVVEHAKEQGYDGAVCGHVHRPLMRRVAAMTYANCGDWLVHKSALAERSDGSLLLLRYEAGADVTYTRDSRDSLAA